MSRRNEPNITVPLNYLQWPRESLCGILAQASTALTAGLLLEDPAEFYRQKLTDIMTAAVEGIASAMDEIVSAPGDGGIPY